MIRTIERVVEVSVLHCNKCKNEIPNKPERAFVTINMCFGTFDGYERNLVANETSRDICIACWEDIPYKDMIKLFGSI